MRYCLLLFFLLCRFALPAQPPPPKAPAKLLSFSDCSKARPMTIAKSFVFGPAEAPEGKGEQQEFENCKPAQRFFKGEHFTAWYKLMAGANGELSFTILPLDSTNDYDFLLFKADSAADFCASIAAKKAQPIRCNLSRTDPKKGGRTGLAPGAKLEFETEGPGEAFCKPIAIHKGETYYLVLDNVYPNGKGHRIQFNLVSTIDVAGKAADDSGKPLANAQVMISNAAGDTIETTTTSITGSFKMTVHTKPKETLTVTIEGKDHFFATQDIQTDKPATFQTINATLPELKEGKRFTVNSINFVGGQDVVVPSSIPSVTALQKMMQKNPEMKITIEGHVNGCIDQGIPAQQLSEMRAARIRNYLLAVGISGDRIKTAGYGCSRMLYPVPKSEYEALMNRRVEILVNEY